MVWLAAILLYLHVLGAILWFGSSVMFQYIFVPALAGMPFEAQRPWLHTLAARYGPAIGVVGAATLLLGVLRGISTSVLGTLNSPYGITWMAAIVFAIPLGVLGAGFIGPTGNKVAAAGSGEEVLALAARMSRYARLEVANVLFLLALMIAMHVGY